MKICIFSAAITFASIVCSVANAQVIFDVLAGDSVFTFSNGDSVPPTFTLTPPTATLTRDTAGLSHFVSINNIQTLNGGIPFTATDVVTATWVVDSITNYTNPDPAATQNNPNGIEFGLVPNVAFRNTRNNVGTISRFRAESSLANANRVGNGFGNLFDGGPGQSENEPTVEGVAVDDATGLEATAESFADGFTVVQTISAEGVSTQYRNIVVTDQNGDPTGGTVLTTVLQPYTAADFDFVTFINGAHFYAGSDIDRGALGGGVVTFSIAQIEINAVTGPDCLLGDVDLSGTVDFDDIAPFIGVLSGGGSQCEADVNESGRVDFDDIAPFIAILSDP